MSSAIVPCVLLSHMYFFRMTGTGVGVAGMDRLGVSTLLTLIILLGVSLLGFFSRLFAVIRFESIIHEFDPWFNYRATYQMVTMGFYDFLNWFDELAWYPLGRIVGGTVYPGLMFTAGSIHWFLNTLGKFFITFTRINNEGDSKCHSKVRV